MKGSNLKHLANIVEQMPKGTKYEYSIFDMETKKDWDGTINITLRLPQDKASTQRLSNLVGLLSDNEL